MGSEVEIKCGSVSREECVKGKARRRQKGGMNTWVVRAVLPTALSPRMTILYRDFFEEVLVGGIVCSGRAYIIRRRLRQGKLLHQRRIK